MFNYEQRKTWESQIFEVITKEQLDLFAHTNPYHTKIRLDRSIDLWRKKTDIMKHGIFIW